MKTDLTQICIIALAAVGLFMSGCKEDLEPEPATYSRLLTGDDSKSWQRISRDLIIEIGGVTDTIGFNRGIPPCQTDDVFIFYREGRVFELGEGNSRCDEEDESVIVSGRWRLNQVNRIIDLGTEEPYTLVSLKEDELIWGYDTQIGLNTSVGVVKDIPAFLFETYVPAN